MRYIIHIIIGIFIGFMISRPIAEYALYKYRENREHKEWIDFHNKYSSEEIYDMVVTSGIGTLNTKEQPKERR